MGPLAGVRVLDLSRLLPGPYATFLLAHLGAEIIKVEDPKGGDYARWYPPLFGEPPTGASFQALNQGKRSVALDLKQPEAKVALRALVARADVLVDSFRPGVLERLDLDPLQLMAEHPRLIYCAITGFGRTGPDAQRPGHDLGYVARAGVLGLSGPAAHPVAPGVQIADIGAALVAVAGINAALLLRAQTGRGSVVDASLLEAALNFAAFPFSAFAAGETPQRGQELLDGSRPCYGVYRCRDGFLAVSALEPKFWQAFLQVVELPHLLGSALDLGEAGERVKREIEDRLLTRTRAEWMALFNGVEACVEPISSSLQEVAQDPQVMARGALSPLGVQTPIRVHDPLASWAPTALSPAPALGAHTRDVLEEAGLPAELVDRLVAGSAF
ncbi:MAG: CoA transferase [Deltaproteobacteria bacterium]|nr:CoA transferase [Deltaproteobacteria bacterium]